MTQGPQRGGPVGPVGAKHVSHGRAELPVVMLPGGQIDRAGEEHGARGVVADSLAKALQRPEDIGGMPVAGAVRGALDRAGQLGEAAFELRDSTFERVR